MIDRPTTSSLPIHESSIPTLVVESLSTTDTTIVVSTKIADTEMSSVEDILFPIVVAPTKQEIMLAFPQGGMYFDGK